MIVEINHKFELYPNDAPEALTWNNAIKYCTSLGDGWRLPTRTELLYCYEAKVGGFAPLVYWSAAEYNHELVWAQGCNSGYQAEYGKDDYYRVRAVRTIGDES